MDRRWMPAIGVAIMSLAAGLWWGRGVAHPPVPAPTVPSTAAGAAGTTTGVAMVHISGWVAEPGLVEVPSGSRVGDVLAAAGGARPGARLDAMNLAEVVSDGRQIRVPGPEESPDQAASKSAEAGGDGLIHLNSATRSDLESLPGVGPVLAERIVSHREAHGHFERVEDLLDVSGIGEAKLASLRDLVTVP